jgi:hypothetical protein
VRIGIFKDVTGAPGAVCHGVGGGEPILTESSGLLIETEKVSTCKTTERKITSALCQSVYKCVCGGENIIKATRLESGTAKINNKRRFLYLRCVALYFLSAAEKEILT